jgi:ABC-type multidrug transport system ATPase subunit
MSERILQALMQLFAIGAALERLTLQSRETVEAFLRQQVSLQRIPEYLSMYDDFFARFEQSDDDTRIRKRIAGGSVRMLRICTEINKELNTRQKYIVFLRLAEFMQSSPLDLTAEEKEFLETVATVFTIEADEYLLSLALTSRNFNPSACDSSITLFVNANEENKNQNAHHLFRSELDGQMAFLYLRRAQIIALRYTGQERLTVNGQLTDISRVTFLTQGAVVRSQKILPLYFSDLLKSFMSLHDEERFHFLTKGLEYVFPNGKKGLHDLSFAVESGSLVGIMGSSGAGKSTLLSILNGSSKPSAGSVQVNGMEIYESKDLQEGLVGNIPQDDLLIEELTVFQNLYYNTKLCFGNLDDFEIRNKVDNVLDSLGLAEIKDLRVGNVLNKMISGGQRKRLNIGLELVREPSILFVDEPTSGLSSRDAENVMDLLKQLTLGGKLVFVVIHQPSSDIFRMFDQLLMLDTGGFPVYFGNPSDAMMYFKRQVHLTDSEQSECPVCGNINPEQLFNIIELHEVDEFGNSTSTRRITPLEWNDLYRKNSLSGSEEKNFHFVPPVINKATAFRQWKIFFTRDFIAKLSNRQYMLINLLEAPLLAFILGFILRYSTGVKYSLISNPNLPAYLFIGVIVALFLGLSVSAEEIIRDRKIQQRERFLHLSRTGYLLSKVCLLFIISAIQSASFVIIGNLMMGVYDMNFTYWLILFSTSCFANLLGLNISAALDSAVTVYILIPFLLIPQILLSGVIVRFDKLNPAITTQEGVPLIGNVMTSRWAFEALAVEQFSNNPFEKMFFPTDAIMSQATYKKDWWLPAMRERLSKCENLINEKALLDSFETPLKVLRNGFMEEASNHPAGKFSFINELDKNKINQATIIHAGIVLDELKEYYIDQYNVANEKKEKNIASMTGTPALNAVFNNEKNKYENESLEEMVRNSNQKERIVVTKEKIIQRFEPVYHVNASEEFFKAPLFSAVKNFHGKMLSTLYSNILVIWMMTIILYITLRLNLFRIVINLFGKK